MRKNKCLNLRIKKGQLKMLKEGMILKPNINNMEFSFGNKDTLLRIEQIGMERVFCTDLNTGEYLGDIGEPEEILFYYDVVS